MSPYPPPLSPQALQDFERHGVTRVQGWFTTAQVRRLKQLTDDLARWPETPGKWMHYFERAGEGDDARRLLCRTEAFFDHQEELAGLLNSQRLKAALVQILGEPAELFKEKVNYKLPGGGAYAAHQDALAFSSFGQSVHVSVMVPVESAAGANGGLEFVLDTGQLPLLPSVEGGAITPAWEATQTWSALDAHPGDIVIFHSFVPHRSGPNPTAHPRRAYYLTYNKASEGDRRAAYYAAKRAAFPQDCERVPGKVYDPGVFNVGNPIGDGEGT